MLRLLRKVSLVSFLAILVLVAGPGDYRPTSLDLTVAPYRYSVVRWEFANFLDKWVHKLETSLPWSAEPSRGQRVALAEEFFAIGTQLRELDRRLLDAGEIQDGGVRAGDRSASLEAEISALKERRDRIQADVEEAMEAEISAILAEEGFASRGGFIFPPVDTVFTGSPGVLVLSPRGRIHRLETILLVSGLADAQRELIEGRVLGEENLAALVASTGGVASYPSVVADSAGLHHALVTTAHEWLHHWFFFRPLGQHFWDNAQMTTLNETAATLAGQAIGDRAYTAMTEPLPMVKGDFFVVRSAEDTLGGGQVVDPSPRRRHRRFNTQVIEQLMMLDQGTGEDVLLSVAEQWGPCDLTTLSRRTNLPVAEVLTRAGELEANGKVVVLGALGEEADAVVYAANGWATLTSQLGDALRAHHRRYPLRRGAPAQEIRSRLGLSQSVFSNALARLGAEGQVAEEGQTLRTPTHQISLTPQMEKQADAYLSALQRDPYSPSSDQPLDPELLGVLVDSGKVVKVSDSVVFTAPAYQDMTDKIIAHLNSKGSITVAEARTMFNSSRKYLLPLLEYLDQQHVTRRVGDERVLR